MTKARRSDDKIDAIENMRNHNMDLVYGDTRACTHRYKAWLFELENQGDSSSPRFVFRYVSHIQLRCQRELDIELYER